MIGLINIRGGALSVLFRMQILKQNIPEKLEVLVAKIKGIDPLELQILSDQKRVINEDILTIPRHLTAYNVVGNIEAAKAEIDLSNELCACTVESNSEHNHDAPADIGIYEFNLTVKNQLEVNDIVTCISYNYGQKYYIIDRVV